jgi:hypothetical protein
MCHPARSPCAACSATEVGSKGHSTAATSSFTLTIDYQIEITVHLQPSRIGASELAASILGPWERAPKAGRDAYERYTAAISAVLGGEASTQACNPPASACCNTSKEAEEHLLIGDDRHG